MTLERYKDELSKLPQELKLTAAVNSVTIAGLTLVENRERYAQLYAERHGVTVESARIRIEVANRVLLLMARDMLTLETDE